MILSKAQINGFKRYLIQEEKSDATQEKYLRDVEALRLFLGEAELTKELMIRWNCSKPVWFM